MIQIITDEKSFNNTNYDVSTLLKPKSLDAYQINIVNLNSEYIWEYNGRNLESINTLEDIENLGEMIKLSTKSINVVVLPQD